MTLRADETIAVLVYEGTVIGAHMIGRAREGKPVQALGRLWDVIRIKPTDGAHLVELRARPQDGPLMCSSCGSFGFDQPGGPGDPFECQDCPHRGRGDGATF